MKKITFIFLFLCSISFGQNLGNPAIIGQTNRNQKVGKGLQVTDTLITDGVVILKNLATFGSGVDTGVGFKNGKIVRFLYTGGGASADSQSLSLAFSDSIRMSISRGNTISFAYAYDSVSTNTAGDSIITFKAGLRRAYKVNSGSSGSTFNGLKLVTTSRDLDSTDVGYVLVLFTDSLELTMPEIAPFKDNDNIAIASFADNCSVVTTFGTPELYLLGFAENRTQTIQMQYSAA